MIPSRPSDNEYSIHVVDQADNRSFEDWDRFVCGSARGHFVCLTSWLESFRTYSVPFFLIVATEKESPNTIVGGVTLLQYGNRWLGWMVSPFGPVVAQGHECLAQPLVDAAEQFARQQRMAILQINQACSSHGSPMLLPDTPLSTSRYLRPNPKPIGGGATQILWIEFPNEPDESKWDEALLATFHKKTRKNIRVAETNGVEVTVCESNESIREAYGVIEENGKRAGYATRAWSDVGSVLEKQIRLGHGVMHLAKHNGNALGALYCGTAGRRYQTVMQGTIRTNPDLKIGHALHWHAFKNAKRLGLLGCDLSADGNAGIKAFKESFLPCRMLLNPPLRLVFSSLKNRMIIHLLPKLLRHKKLISSIMRRSSKT